MPVRAGRVPRDVAVWHHCVVRGHARGHQGVSREAQGRLARQVMRIGHCRCAIQRLRDRAPARGRARGARRCRHRAGDVEVLRVPGAFEIPMAAQRVAETGQVDAVVCLGCLIRGATPHFEYIASACAHGITAAAASTGVPMSFGVLTTNSAEEALERAAPGPANKGARGGGRRARNGAAVCAVARWALTVPRTRRPRRAGDRWAGRHRARAAALQAFYECEIGGLDAAAGAGRAASRRASGRGRPGREPSTAFVDRAREGRDAESRCAR